MAGGSEHRRSPGGLWLTLQVVALLVSASTVTLLIGLALADWLRGSLT